jgi:hypothetical protein
MRLVHDNCCAPYMIGPEMGGDEDFKANRRANLPQCPDRIRASSSAVG